MHLSLLSDGYISDSLNDAGSLMLPPRAPGAGAIHFAALCRGLVVLLALALPIGLTLLARAPLDPDQRNLTRFTASPRASNG